MTDQVPTASSAAPPPAAAQSTFVSASDPNVAVMGRLERAASRAVRMGYPGVTLRVRFEGPSLGVKVSSNTPNSRIVVVVDGGEPRKLRLAQGASDVVLAEGLSPGAHSLDLVHATETWQGILTVSGFTLPPGGKLLAPEPWPSRKMLFVGDSVTCGDGADPQRTADPTNKDQAAGANGYYSYGMRLARSLGAQCQLVCFGGRGLIRDWHGNTDGLNAPQFFDLAVPDEAAPVKWDHGAYVPDVVVVSLGTNDFNLALGALPEKKTYVAAYVAFAKAIRARYPAAQVLLTEGAIVNDKADPKRPQKTVLRSHIKETVRQLGDPNVRFVAATHYPGDASNAHPTDAQHAAMAKDLEPVVRQLVGWKQ